MLMEHLISYVDSLTEEGTEMMLDLMCAKGREAVLQPSWISGKAHGASGAGHDPVPG